MRVPVVLDVVSRRPTGVTRVNLRCRHCMGLDLKICICRAEYAFLSPPRASNHCITLNFFCWFRS